MWQNCLSEENSTPYLQHHFVGQHISRVQFCPYEDVLGVGHSNGFASLIIPGTMRLLLMLSDGAATCDAALAFMVLVQSLPPSSLSSFCFVCLGFLLFFVFCLVICFSLGKNVLPKSECESKNEFFISSCYSFMVFLCPFVRSFLHSCVHISFCGCLCSMEPNICKYIKFICFSSFRRCWWG